MARITDHPDMTSAVYRGHKHPAGDVLWVFVEPGNVVPEISVAGHRCWLSRAKNRLKNAKIPLCLVRSREPFMSGA